VRQALEKPRLGGYDRVVARPVILCVDDETIVLGSLKRQLLGPLGAEFAIETAESAAEALELSDELAEEGVHLPLVISDHIMPMMNGAELLIELHHRRPNTHKVLLTGQADAQAVGSVVNAGALYRYLGKPWQQSDLVLTIREACRSYFRDVRLQEQNDELRHARSTLQQLIAGIAHEANTPVGAIVSSSNLITRSVDRALAALAVADPTAAAKTLAGLGQTANIVERAGRRLADLMASTQRFVSLDEAEQKVVDIGQRLDDALTLVAASADTRTVTRVDDGMAQARVLCFPAQLSDIFINLLNNAVAATGPSGTIRTHLRETDDKVIVSVEDDGRGMSADLLREVFVPGFATKSEQGRTGMRLGLALCKRHAEAVGGAVKLESHVGEGTKATLTLPRHR